MDEIVAGYLAGIEMGAPTTVERIGLVPLFNAAKVNTPYVALKTALEGGMLLIEESHESGTVGQLKVANKGAVPVLLLDGEELAGAKQNRVLNTTILVPANMTTPIPVSCTEQGRWSYVSPRFEESLSVAPPRVRRSNQTAVADSLRASGQFAGNQSEVWSRVREISDEADVRSPTSAMRDVFEKRLPALDEVTGKFPVATNQIGLVAIVDNAVIGLDIVTRPEVYELLHIKLVRSYVLDASLRRDVPAHNRELTKLARSFLDSTQRTSESRHESVGLGYDYRYTGTDIVGSALAYKADMIHCAFFTMPPEEQQPHVHDNLSSHTHRRGFRM
ncbi:ARPP-1 family domain-containing protein [Chloroflexota bacterium]